MGVDVAGLTRRFGAGRPALHGVDLAVRQGEFVALLGPSGSGKTTLLRILAGLEFPDAGRVRVGGRDMAGVPARARGVGFVFQHYALFRHMTVFENVAFGLRVRPRARRPAEAEIARRVRDLLALVQVPELERRYPEQISGGQRQRVALARALAIEPPLLLLDEPFGALDAQVRKDLRLWLRGLHDRLGITTLFVTHDQDEAMAIADRIALLRDGRVVQFDAPEALFEHPADAFVAGFLGDSNRLPCVVAGGLACFAPLPLPGMATSLPDGPALAFVRPGALLAAPGEGAVVQGVRHDGRALHLVVAAGGRMLEAAPAPGWDAPRRGDACALSIAEARFFAAQQ
ncbi:ATP-binding cassette domain-containing protein [Paracraurococcus ruber]|uniref:Sulfate ABC transporter ATP-binding protein n=1 Tax=Paracraurococcus ruber TaxID=77675 RepID=A0ABS1CVZ5_9PROT|nr:sulfate ABC transporter ATP-binding protein [Paracraurococcus ruber]TDG32232.1 ATP-binding cassette domain-containing protein [Paracraurococcus ruber]